MKILAPTAAITGLLYYFGWSRTDALYRYFGLDATTLSLSPADYVLRSINASYMPLLWGLLGVLLLAVPALEAVRHLKSRNPEGPVLTAFGAMFALFGLLLAAYGLLQLLQLATVSGPLAIPLSIGLGVLFLRFGAHCLNSPVATALTASRLAAMATWALLGLVALWATAALAQERGTQAAELIANDITRRPEIVIHSSQDLAIAAPGVSMQRSAAPQAKYPIRYAGFHLLQKVDGKYLLIPAGWRHDSQDRRIVVVNDDGTIRVDYE